MPVTTVKAENREQAKHIAQQAGDILRSGGLVVFPTETVYGVAASCASERGMRALRSLKNRPDEPFSVHLPDPAAFERYVGGGGQDVAHGTSAMLRRLTDKVMPGPVTVIVAVNAETRRACQEAMSWSSRMVGEMYHDGDIGLRCPDHALGRQILASVDAPVLASSANREGQRAPTDADEAGQAVGDAVDLMVDGGRCRFAKSSTVVRIENLDGPLKLSVVRPGVYDERYLRKLMRCTVLMLCSGNTCRSPMAAAIARSILAERRGIPVDELEISGVRVLSAGTVATHDTPATPEAVEALRQIGVDLSGHRSKPLGLELIRESDVIYCMTESHRRAVIEMDPSSQQKTVLLDPTGDVEDPLGTGPTGYTRCVELIRRRVEHRLNEQSI